jgi:hypothetical protein
LFHIFISFRIIVVRLNSTRAIPNERTAKPNKLACFGAGKVAAASRRPAVTAQSASSFSTARKASGHFRYELAGALVNHQGPSFIPKSSLRPSRVTPFPFLFVSPYCLFWDARLDSTESFRAALPVSRHSPVSHGFEISWVFQLPQPVRRGEMPMFSRIPADFVQNATLYYNTKISRFWASGGGCDARQGRRVQTLLRA